MCFAVLFSNSSFFHPSLRTFKNLSNGYFDIGEQKMGNTKKVGTAGRFSSRYGVGIRKRVLAVEAKQNSDHSCPFCGFSKVKREAAGLFNCHKCQAKFTGGAYEPQTLIGKTINKMVAQKSFLAGAQELIKAKESSFSDIEREVEKSLAAGANKTNEDKE
jgi:large subunit ribosomal protein L37Ae